MLEKNIKYRLKREDCNRTRHDSVFSKWEILIGACDWEEYSLGKDGVQRYRTHNLPNGSSCPGLYELGITIVPKKNDGRKSRKHDPENIIVVYLGQTNNVRTRLQQYGRIGAHLDAGKAVASQVTNGKNKCSGLFKQVFIRGYSIMFRWAPMIDKKEAEKTETELLNFFDYAWNTCGNAACRHDEILSKLDFKSKGQISNTFLRKFLVWKHQAFGGKAGISIDASVPIDDNDDGKGYLRPHVFKFGKSQIKFMNNRSNKCYENREICGVAIGNGSVCKNMPLLGKKRCEEHKGKKIVGTGSVASKESTIMSQCGLLLEDGSLCADLPECGRKRRELHRGRRSTKLEVVLDIPPQANVNLSDEKETRVEKFYPPQSLERVIKREEEYNICGVAFGDGTVCRRNPVFGRKRCEEHKGRKITRAMPPKMSIEVFDKVENLSLCGVGLGDGSTCSKPPVHGRKRCELHKGRRV